MGLVTLPHNPGNIQNTKVTDATLVMANYAAIIAEVNGNIEPVNIKALAVETAKLAALAVTAAKLATDAVETLKIKDANVTLAKMAANSVDSDQYVDGSIDVAHLAADSVETAKIKNLNVTSGKIAADAIDGTKIGDDVLDSEHYVAGSIDAEHLAADSVETAKIKNLNVTSGKIAADAVDDTKIGDAKIKKEHINADVVGTGLTGGAGTALSVDGIVEANGAELKCKLIEIGDWDMDATTQINNIEHGLNRSFIRDIHVTIRGDTDYDYVYPLNYSDVPVGNTQGSWSVSDTYITLNRLAEGFFDHTNFNATSYNRGWILIWYFTS